LSIALLLAALPTACGTWDDKSVFEQSKQEFRIVPAYEGQARYLEEVEADLDADTASLWREHVVDAYRKDCLAGEYGRLAEDRLSEPIMDVERLGDAVENLRGSDVAQIIEATLRKSARRLPGPDTEICVFVEGDRMAVHPYEETGASGFTTGSGKILLFVNPEGSWKHWIPYVIAHEYHHAAWTHLWTEDHPRQEPLSKLGDYLVFEGRADSFARLLYPNEGAPWTRALTPKEEEEQWKAMCADLRSTDQNLWSQYAFGGLETPRWTLYTIGFHVVQCYLEHHPSQGVEQWTAMNARELLEESGYAGAAC